MQFLNRETLQGLWTFCRSAARLHGKVSTSGCWHNIWLEYVGISSAILTNRRALNIAFTSKVDHGPSFLEHILEKMGKTGEVNVLIQHVDFLINAL
jgi:hypothetical protein